MDTHGVRYDLLPAATRPAAAGSLAASRVLTHDARPVPVVLYHSIAPPGDDPWACAPADFVADMEAMVASGRTPLTATEYAHGLRGELPLPERAVLVTFDDGFANFADRALPVLKRYGLAATLFVTSGWIGRRGMLSAAAIRDIASTGSIEIGAHSVHHPHLDVVGEKRARTEIEQSGAHLADLLGWPTYAFAYPHGSHRAVTVDLVQTAGYRTAHAVKNALSHTADDPYAVARFTVHAGTSRAEVTRLLDGAGVRLGGCSEGLLTKAYRPMRRLHQLIRGPLA